MRKIVLLFLAAVFMTVPAMAAVSNVSITCVQGTGADINSVTVSYASDHNLIRAFGLDITVVGANITKVVPLNANYRIYPGQPYGIQIADGNVTDYGTCYDPCDLGDANVTIEMGSLYTEDPCYAGDANAGYGMKPTQNGTLLKFYVSASCTYAVTKNVARGGVVMENPAEDPNVTLCSGSVVLCPPAPDAATNPSPAHGATCVAIDANLTWTPGANTATQDIYFGTTNPPPLVASGVPVGTTLYNPPGNMVIYTCYYWQIDELNSCAQKTTGTVWRFRTGPTNKLWPCCATCLGDVTGDGWVRVSDITALGNLLRTAPGNRYYYTAPQYNACGDYNQDGYNRTNDITAIGNLLRPLTGNRKQCPTCP
jgi:hypothetical protein